MPPTPAAPATKDATKDATKPSPPKRTHSFEFSGHPYPIRIIFAPSAEAWHKLLKTLAPDEPYPETHGRATLFDHPKHRSVAVITLSPEADNRTPNEVIGLMVHEITHVIQYIEDIIGCRLDRETQAYLTQLLTQWLIESYEDAGRSFTDAPK